MALRFKCLTGQELEQALPDIAALRITVFKEWPYLYDGDLSYERRYLQPLLRAKYATVVGAYDADRLVGASTATPLIDHSEDFGSAFSGTDMDLNTLYYCAESVLLPGYRGRGAGHHFFDMREATARASGFATCCFCAVVRPPDHAMRPQFYRPLDGFWRGRGYKPLPGVVAQFAWKDIGEQHETSKSLQFWVRDL